MLDVLQFEFMQHAILAGLLAGLICGITGTLAVTNRMVFLAGGIAHSAYGGIGLALFLGIPIMAGAMGFSVIAALVMAAISMKAKHRADAAIGVIWALGMAIGVILIDLTPGYQVDLMSYLFGSILTVPATDLWVMAVFAVLTVGLVALYYKELLALSYDEEFARIRGVPVRRLYILLIVMLSVAVVLTIQIVGLILVIALLSIPPFIAEKFTGSMAQMMGWSCLLNIFFILIGLTLSYSFNLTAGACIILMAGVGFFLSIAIERILRINSRTAAKVLASKQEP